MENNNYKIKLPNDLVESLKNVQEMYFENMENDDEDCLGGTEDSYANEMLGQHIADILDNNTILKIKEINSDINDRFGIDSKQSEVKQFEELLDYLINDFADNIETIDTTYEIVLDINDKVYNGNMRIIEKGFRRDEPIALLEKDLGNNEKEYIVAFYYKIEENKLSWGYGYYYDTDISKAKQDYQKVTNGGNLADTFERKEER